MIQNFGIDFVRVIGLNLFVTFLIQKTFMVSFLGSFNAN